jgi:SAM-dependent methyltransferase
VLNSENTHNFRKYSAVYDLLYRDKDYVAEADYVARTIRAAIPDAQRILEFGSGTGRHGRLLATDGFAVHGIDRSPEMVALARSVLLTGEANGSFTCEVGEVASIELHQTFDAVIALFHVICYQTSDRSLRAAFSTATRHLAPRGIFMFDVWHGPAVLAQQPEQRVKAVSNENIAIIRTARPEIDTNRNTVRVTYEMECQNRHTGEVEHFSEEHLVRYLFPAEIETLAADCGMRVVNTEEFMTARPPSPATWGVAYLLQK